MSEIYSDRSFGGSSGPIPGDQTPLVDTSNSWAVANGLFAGQPAGGQPSFATHQPSGYAVGGSQAIVAWTPPGGWGGSPACFAAVLGWSTGGYYLVEARSAACPTAPSVL